MSFAKPIFTTRGKQIELQGIEGQQIVFSKIKIGDGRITTQSPSQLTDLINVIAEAPITSLKRYDAYAAIRSVFQNTDVQEAFWWREVGLFAIDPATKEEVLYAYQNAYDTAEYITPSSLVTKKINWTIYIDDGENLGADIHKKMVFCSVEDLDEHNDLENAHEKAFAAHNADESAHEPAFAAHNNDSSAHEPAFAAHNSDDHAHPNRLRPPLKRSTVYAKGDIAFHDSLPSWAYLECTQAGTTDESEQDFGGGRASDTVTDGTAKFIVRDVRCKYRTGEIVALYGEPKAWDYLLLCDGSTVSEDDYPELCGVLGGNVLPNLVGRVLQGGSVSGEYRSAGLPNITGAANMNGNGAWNIKSDNSGAYAYRADNPDNIPDSLGMYAYAYAVANMRGNFTFNASYSNAIYGNSSTVQPPAMTIKYYICYA